MKKKNKKPTEVVMPKPEKGFFYHLGNLMIILSLLLVFVIFYPVISTYLFPKPILAEASLKGDFITIPKIHAQAPLIFNVDPWKESEYKKILKNGVAHAKGTSLPGEKGRSFIFAHSSGNPIEQTKYNTVFVRLGDLKIGDEISIKRKGKVYKYQVTMTKVVNASDTQYLEKNESDGIVIQTCWPIGTSLKRLLVFAAPKA